eukprot:s4720_g8.t1
MWKHVLVLVTEAPEVHGRFAAAWVLARSDGFPLMNKGVVLFERLLALYLPDLAKHLNGASPNLLLQAGAVRVRAVGGEKMPFRFPVRVCEVPLPKGLPANSIRFGDKVLPKLSLSPRRTVLLGDTGLRVAAENDGTCLAPGPDKLYGIEQCAPNETVPFNSSLVAGRFQSLEDWPFQVQSELAARDEPDLVVHVGDYFYRQGPCPKNQNCSAINNQSFPNSPGLWGDNWNGWYADFFEPSLSLLSAAPWIFLRGNHERCGRGGNGYFLFLEPRPYPELIGGEYCQDYTDPYAVTFADTQFVILDTAMVDDVKTDDKCPKNPTGSIGTLNRLDDPNQSLTKAEILEQVEIYRRHFEESEKLRTPGKTHFLFSHHPIFGFVCHQGKFFAIEWTLQQALSNNTYKDISASIHGHVHMFQAFKADGLPLHLIVGNGGTKLQPYLGKSQGPVGLDLVLPPPYEGARLATSAYCNSTFGYNLMDADLNDGFFFKALRLPRRGRMDAEELMWNTTIPSLAALSKSRLWCVDPQLCAQWLALPFREMATSSSSHRGHGHLLRGRASRRAGRDPCALPAAEEASHGSTWHGSCVGAGESGDANVTDRRGAPGENCQTLASPCGQHHPGNMRSTNVADKLQDCAPAEVWAAVSSRCIEKFQPTATWPSA